jgi:uncharacterized protein with von Willebrand factor type A (vWA) domain
MRFHYSRWDGTQDPFGPDLSASELLERMGDDILAGAGAEFAMGRLLRKGMRGRFLGTDALAARLRRARRLEQERLDLEGPLAEVQRRLEEILERERRTLSFRADEDARMREQSLDQLPPDLAGQLKELREYRFADAEAQRDFDELMRWLSEQVLGAYFRDMAGGMRNLSSDDLRRIKDMLADLNAMIEARERGEHTQEAFHRFMERYGDMFPWGPRNLDELLEGMARRMAALSRLMASLPPESRRELEELARQVMSDLDLAFEADRLAAHLSDLFPQLPWEQPANAGGEEAMPLEATVDALERLHDYEELERSLRGDYAGASLEDVDEEALRRRLGEDAVRDIRRLKEVERALEHAGLVVRRQGRLEVTPRGARQLGERALARVFERLRRDREGTHDSRDAAGLAEPTGATRPWAFGDAGRIHVQRTVFNAVVRRGGRGGSSPGVAPSVDEKASGPPGPEGPRGSVALAPDDFELEEAETRSETATALLLDLSFSMPLRGHFVHAKRMALALHALIEGRYPNDHLYLIGFSDYARQMQPEDLTAAGWERVYGTNMQHAFNLAARLLARHPRTSRQVIMVTDGEPTAHLEGDQVFFSWPPVPETIRRTLSEAMRLSRAGVTFNVFMLEESPGLARFMERLARLTSGRVFLMSSENVGEFVLRDYVRRRAS